MINHRKIRCTIDDIIHVTYVLVCVFFVCVCVLWMAHKCGLHRIRREIWDGKIMLSLIGWPGGQFYTRLSSHRAQIGQTAHSFTSLRIETRLTNGNSKRANGKKAYQRHCELLINSFVSSNPQTNIEKSPKTDQVTARRSHTKVIDNKQRY